MAIATNESTANAHLAGAWVALGTLNLRDRSFVAHLLLFTAILWGTIGRGAFYRLDLIVFTSLAIAAGLAAPRFWRVLSALRWVWSSAIAITIAVGVSAAVNGQLSDVGYAIAPVAAAIGLAVAGAALSETHGKYLVMRIVVDVTLLAAILSWLGVALHIQAWAQPLNQGWRASATIGYANVTGLLLLIGLLYACGLATTSESRPDLVRCWLLALGMLTTQSRSVLVAAIVCLVLLWFMRRTMAKTLAIAIASALIPFCGLLPSIRSEHTSILTIATASATIALSLTMLLRYSRQQALPGRVAAIGLTVAAAGLGAVALRTRLLDIRSESGRLHLWRDVLGQLSVPGLFGRGPHELAELSRERLVTLLLHNDLFQFAAYYGILGLLTVIWVGWQVFRAARRASRATPLGVTAIVVLIAICIVASVDFPLQVPVVPGLTSLTLGVLVGPTTRDINFRNNGRYIASPVPEGEIRDDARPTSTCSSVVDHKEQAS